MIRSVQIMDKGAMDRSLARITHEIIEKNSGCEDLVILGIKNKGIPLARTLCANLKKFQNADVPFGYLDVTNQRDDLTADEKISRYSESKIPCNLTNKTVLIVDDVLFTGRTARAAIEAVFSTARPKALQLAVLIDRGHREIPIRPDYVGKNIPTSRNEKILVDITDNSDNGVFILSEQE